MKIEVRCPDCAHGWQVDADARGELLCPSCMTRIPLGGVTAGTGGVVAQADTDEIACPRCNFHFVPSSRPALVPSNRATVLVVDELNYFRELVKQALSPTFAVQVAADADAAHRILGGGAIDLLILDGNDSGRALLTALTPKPCPVLVFSAQDESEIYGECWEELRRLGADDLVIKGMNVDETLLRKAHALLGVTCDE